MSTILLVGVGGIYTMVALDYLFNDRYGMAIAFFAYALANIGFALDLRQ